MRWFNKKISMLLPALLTLLGHANLHAQYHVITVKNDLTFGRDEVVAVPLAKISGLLRKDSKKNIRIQKQGAASYLATQWIDMDYDGEMDALLFQVEVGANASVRYRILIDSLREVPLSESRAYSRFVPERSDDFAWENDRVAFRVYGPKGQQEALHGIAGSTLSSGIDIWLKRVDYPIIDSWYKKNIELPGYYHTDRGEGYDPYHVGNSRGLGGTGIWVNGTFQVSGNFSSYAIIANGHLRTVFELRYTWEKDGIEEVKRITLDKGSHFSKFEIDLTSKTPIENFAVGLTLHDNKGKSKSDAKKGWFRYWEAVDDSFVGEGIVIAPLSIASVLTRVSQVPDQSHIIATVKSTNQFTYYAGFAWTKSGQVARVSDWDKILEEQALRIKYPLKVVVGKQVNK